MLSHLAKRATTSVGVSHNCLLAWTLHDQAQKQRAYRSFVFKTQEHDKSSVGAAIQGHAYLISVSVCGVCMVCSAAAQMALLSRRADKRSWWRDLFIWLHTCWERESPRCLNIYSLLAQRGHWGFLGRTRIWCDVFLIYLGDAGMTIWAPVRLKHMIACVAYVSSWRCTCAALASEQSITTAADVSYQRSSEVAQNLISRLLFSLFK